MQRAAGWQARTIPVLLLAACYAAAWGLGLAWAHRTVPLDSAEQLVWAYSLEGGYWKHPPMPSWLLHGFVAVFGPSVTLPFVATLACVAIALLFVWRLGCEIVGPAQSLAATALTSLVSYHCFGADAFNHNTVLLPFQAGATLAFYLAARRRSLALWAVAGAAAGLAMLVKYVAIFPLAALVLWFLLDRSLHARRNVAGLLVALAGAAFVFAPHVLWLVRHDYLPLRYAGSVTAHAPDAFAQLRNLGDFLGTQLQRLAPMGIVLAWLWRRSPRAASRAPGASSDRLFLWMAGAGPLALMLLYAVATGTLMLSRWGTNLFLLSGLLAVDAIGRTRRLPLRPVLSRVLAVQLLLWVAVVLVVPALGDALQVRGRARFPGRQLAAAAASTWVAQTGTPLHLLVSDIWLAGNVDANGPRPLAVLIDGVAARAPWVSERDVARCGALVLRGWEPAGDAPEPGVDAYMARAVQRGVWMLGGTPGAAATRIEWGILPPQERGSGCRL